MKKSAFERLHPFLHHKGARQKLILYLIADGHSVADCVVMDLKTLRALDLPDEIAVCRDEAIDGRKSGLAFVYPSGQPIPHTAYYRLLRNASKKAIGRPLSQITFREYLNDKRG